MSSSLPTQSKKASSSPPRKRMSLGRGTGSGTTRNDIKKLPAATKSPGALVADVYGSGTSPYNSVPSRPKIPSGNRTSYPGSGGKRGNGRQRSIEDVGAGSVVVIDSDEGELCHDDVNHSPHQTKASGDYQAPKVLSAGLLYKGANLEDEDMGSPVQIFERLLGDQEKSNAISSQPSEGIPPLSVLKTQSPTQDNPQGALRQSDKEEIGSKRTASLSGSNSAGVAASSGSVEYLTADSRGGQDGNNVQCHTVASSSTESDDSVQCMETTSHYFTSKRSGRESGVVSVTDDVRPRLDCVSPSADSLTVVESDQPSPRKPFHSAFVPRCKGHSPDKLKNIVEHSQHNNLFAKNQSSTRTDVLCTTSPERTRAFENPKTGRKTADLLTKQTLSTTPTLSKDSFTFSVNEKKESKITKNSRTMKNKDVRMYMCYHSSIISTYNMTRWSTKSCVDI